MPEFTEIDISRAIIDAYHHRLSDVVESDVLIVGAGPSGMGGPTVSGRNGTSRTRSSFACID